MTRHTGTQVATQEAPLTPEQRRELVNRPFPAVRVVVSGRSWGGTGVSDWVSEGRTRAYTAEPSGRMAWLKTVGE